MKLTTEFYDESVKYSDAVESVSFKPNLPVARLVLPSTTSFKRLLNGAA